MKLERAPKKKKKTVSNADKQACSRLAPLNTNKMIGCDPSVQSKTRILISENNRKSPGGSLMRLPASVCRFREAGSCFFSTEMLMCRKCNLLETG